MHGKGIQGASPKKANWPDGRRNLGVCLCVEELRRAGFLQARPAVKCLFDEQESLEYSFLVPDPLPSWAISQRSVDAFLAMTTENSETIGAAEAHQAMRAYMARKAGG